MSYKSLLWWAERSQVHQVTSMLAEHLTSYKGKWDLSKEQEAIRKADTVTVQSAICLETSSSLMPTDHFAFVPQFILHWLCPRLVLRAVYLHLAGYTRHSPRYDPGRYCECFLTISTGPVTHYYNYYIYYYYYYYYY